MNTKTEKPCVKGVSCDVRGCRYHQSADNRCTAEHISVENKTALNKGETFCGTFTPKSSF